MGFVELFAEVRAVATAYPGAYEETPWGELAAKVNKKAFAFYTGTDAKLSITVKLRDSHIAALEMPECSPTGYGLGRHGWVSASFTDEESFDLPTVLGWLEESYRAVAPKRLSKTVPEGGPLPGEEAPIPELPADAPDVIVVSDDALRAARAVRGLAASGIRGHRATTSDLDALADADAAAIVVDLGRSASIALELAGHLALLHFDCPLVLAGIRDAKFEATARQTLPAASAWLRSPPGDDRVIAQVVAVVR